MENPDRHGKYDGSFQRAMNTGTDTAKSGCGYVFFVFCIMIILGYIATAIKGCAEIFR